MPDIDRTIATDIQVTAERNLFVDQDAIADECEVSQAATSRSAEQAVDVTADAEAAEAPEEPPAVDPSRVEIIFRHASGSARLLVPSDVPLAELLPEFLELAGIRERGDEWTLASADGGELRYENTLAECDVHDRDAVVLQRRGATPRTSVPRAPRNRASGATKSPQAKPARRKRPTNATGRALSERTARALPAELTAIERVREALRALRGDKSSVAATPPAPAGVPSPGAFALPARAPLRVRMHDAWAGTADLCRLERMIVSPRLSRSVTIAVVSPKGGVGKTTTAALLGSLLAFLRRDRVVAVDTNPDWGSLGRRLAPGHTVFIDDLLAGPLGHSPHSSAIELDAQLGRGPDGLMVAPAPTEPERASRLDEDAYHTLFGRLAGLVGTLILDCGTGLDSPAARAALACSDQLVLVTDGEPDTASLVAEAAERRLAPRAPALVLVVNKLDRSSRVDVTALERRIDFADGLVLVPNNRAGADALHGSRFSWNHAPSFWQTAFRELAALLAAGWLRRDVAR